MSKCASCEEKNIPLTLQQGYQFNQNQVKILSKGKKGKKGKKILLDEIPSADREDYREIGYPNVGIGLLEKMNFYELIDGSTSFRENFQNNNSSGIDRSILTQPLPSKKEVIVNYFSELDTLDAQFNSVLEQYNSSQAGYTNELNKYVQKANDKSSFQNKNISLSDGKQYYVNLQNVAKAFSTDTAYSNTQSKNNCPAGITNIGVNTLPNNLILGSNMNAGQSCGNEGINVYVNKVNANPQTAYLGCYKDSCTTPTMTALSNGNAIYDYDTCMKLAADNNSPYFALENMNPSTGLAKCNIGSNLSSIQQYGIAYNVESNNVWNSETRGSGPNTMIMKNDGNLIVQNNSSQQVVWSSSTAVPGCAGGGMIQPNSFSGTYGINCTARGYKVNSDNASDALNINFGSTPKSSWSLGINNGVYGDPAWGCWKDFTASYSCGDNETKTVKGMEGGTAVFNCGASTKSCNFYLLLNDNGNLCLFQGTPGSSGANSYWCSNSIAKDIRPNPDWNSQKGKYGVNYVKTGQTLSPGEWIGSPTGTAKLMMDTDGALRIFVSSLSKTPNCYQGRNGKILGNSTSNAVYSLANNGVISSVGKVGYINSNSQIQEYPNSMFSYDNNYDTVNGFDSLGNTLQNGVLANTTVEECKQKCNANENCAGFVFDTTTNIGELKSKIYPNIPREPNSNKNIYSRKKKIENANSCSKQVVEVDSVLWNNYPVAALMTPTTKCGISQELEDSQSRTNQLKEQMNNISSKIMGVVKKITTMNVDINQKMGTNNKSLDDYIQKYKIASTQIKSDLAVDVVNRTSILDDTNIYVLEENYKYMLWSTLAIAGIILTMNIIRSQ